MQTATLSLVSTAVSKPESHWVHSVWTSHVPSGFPQCSLWVLLLPPTFQKHACEARPGNVIIVPTVWMAACHSSHNKWSCECGRRTHTVHISAYFSLIPEQVFGEIGRHFLWSTTLPQKHIGQSQRVPSANHGRAATRASVSAGWTSFRCRHCATFPWPRCHYSSITAAAIRRRLRGFHSRALSSIRTQLSKDIQHDTQYSGWVLFTVH